MGLFSAIGDLFSSEAGTGAGTASGSEASWHNGWGTMPDWTMTAESGGTEMVGTVHDYDYGTGGGGFGSSGGCGSFDDFGGMQ